MRTRMREEGGGFSGTSGTVEGAIEGGGIETD